MTKITWTKVGASCVAVLGAAFATALIAAGHSPSAATTPAAFADQKASFEVLRQGEATTLPKRIGEAFEVVGKRFALDVDSARQTVADDGTKMWVVPGTDNICLAVDDTDGVGVSCNTTSEALDGRVLLVEHSTKGGPDTAFGLVPDGTTTVIGKSASGSVQGHVKGNVYVLHGRALDELAVGDTGRKIIDLS